MVADTLKDQKSGGKQLNIGSAPHGQVFYNHVDSNKEARGINGPLFTRKVPK
jgi:hypothetical protein